MQLENLRREYLRGDLRHRDLLADPIKQFEQWLEEAIAMDVIDPTAMVLATVDAEGLPSQRIVLLKQLDQGGMVFYTNYESRKGRQLQQNPRVSLLFPWYGIERQVLVRGYAEKVSEAQSREYFLSRPRDSQLAAWASRQSHPIESRDTLMDGLEEVRARFEGGDVPLPPFWGGVRVRPWRVEFWQGGAARLHDRFEYLRDEKGKWQIHRLSP